VLPYFELRTIELTSGFSVSAFGLLVAAGLLAGTLFAETRARGLGLRAELHTAILWAVVPGLIVSHLVALLPEWDNPAARNPCVLLAFWNGMSSLGGLAGAFLGLAFYYHRLGRRSWLPVADVLVQALVIGWVFGRLGCALIHDHVGRPSAFWLAVRFPDGSRHDLGLYELLYTVIVLVPAVIVLNRKTRPPGATVAAIALLYGPARFVLDFLRNSDLPGADVRYSGLTLAQYGCIVLTAVGLAIARRLARPQP